MTISIANGLGHADVLIDDDDAPLVTPHDWHVNSNGYAVTRIAGRWTYMHRLILNPPAGLVVDHQNHNRLDNRRCNIRVCTQAENLANRITYTTLLERKMHPRNRTGHSGVYEYRPGRYRVFIRGKGYGIYDSIEAAAAARRKILALDK